MFLLNILDYKTKLFDHILYLSKAQSQLSCCKLPLRLSWVLVLSLYAHHSPEFHKARIAHVFCWQEIGKKTACQSVAISNLTLLHARLVAKKTPQFFLL